MTDRTRRGFLIGTASAAGAAALPFLLPAAAAARPRPPLALPPGDRMLGFVNLHTNEAERVTYFRDGQYLPQGLAAMNRALRDWRTDDVTRMDPEALDILWALSHKLGRAGQPFGLISAYRSPRTNATLHAMGRGVAKRSYHMRGMAIDVRLDGVEPVAVARAAQGLHAGGVGLYRRSGFVHVDTGPVRRWGF
jgi:uncharacterized protein YcbK (DUF882 family)